MSATKMRGLIAYLTAAPRFVDTRRRLAGNLWASRGDQQALHSMRELLSRFKRGVGPEASKIVAIDEINICAWTVRLSRSIGSR